MGKKLRFLKMESFGNSFVILDGSSLGHIKNFSLLAKKSCDQSYGIGADGLLIHLPSSKADARMVIVNADGSYAAMCGNGIRCFAQYLYLKKIVKQSIFTVETSAGIIGIKLVIKRGNIISIEVDMGKAEISSQKIPVKTRHQQIIAYPISINGKLWKITSLLIGVPHTVIFVKKLSIALLQKIGPKLANHRLFPEKTNVNLVQIVDRKHLAIMTYERGVGYTKACGTGAASAVVAAGLNGLSDNKATVNFGYGKILVTWQQEKNRLFLTGKAPSVICQGELNLRS